VGLLQFQVTTSEVLGYMTFYAVIPSAVKRYLLGLGSVIGFNEIIPVENFRVVCT
jgi:hypothetical protein